MRHAAITEQDRQRQRRIRQQAPLRTRGTFTPNLDHRFHARLEDARLANSLELSREQARQMYADLGRFIADCEEADDGPDIFRAKVEIYR